MMRPSNNTTQKTKTSKAKRFLKRVLVVIVVLGLLIFFLVPLYLSSSSGNNFIVGRINNAVDGRVDIGSFSMGWFRGVHLSDLSFVDNAGLANVNVKSISAKPRYVSCLLGDIAISRAVVDEPRVVINLKDTHSAVTSKATPPKTTDRSAPTGKRSGPRLREIDLELRKGDVTINSLDSTGRAQSLQFSNIESKLDINPAGKNSSFDVSMDVDGDGKNGTISAKGDLTPAKKKSWTLKGTSGDFAVKIKNLDLETLAPVFALAGKDIDTSGTLNADMDVRIDDGRFEKLSGSAVLAGFKQKVAGKETVLAEPVKIEAQISSDKERVNIDKLNLTSSFCNLNCKGGANAVDYTMTANLAGLQDFTGQFTDMAGYKAAGDLQSSGKVVFDKGSLQAKGKGTFKNMTITNKDKKSTPPASIDVVFDIDAQTDKELLKVTALQAQAAGIGQLKITNSVLPLAETTKDKLAANVSADLNLDRAQAFANVFGLIGDKIDIDGALKSDILVSKVKTAFHIVTDRTQIANLKIAKEGQAKPYEEKLLKLRADVIADPEQYTYMINTLQVDSTHIDITEGKLSKISKKGTTKLDGQFEAEYDLAEVSKMAQAYIPENLTMEGKRKDTIKFRTHYPDDKTDKMLANMNAEAKFGFDKAEFMGLQLGRAESDLKIDSGKLTLTPFQTTANGGKLAFGGGIDFNEKVPTLTLAKAMPLVENVAINDKMAGQMLKYLNPIFANQVNISGIANFHCDKLAIPLAADKKETIEVVGTVGMENVKLRAAGLMGQIMSVGNKKGETNLTIMPTKFALQKGVLSYKDMQINVEDNPVNFAGAIGLDKSLNMKVTLPYTISGETVKVGQESANRIALPIEGTVDNPSINASKVIETIGQETLENELKRQLEKLLEKEKLEDIIDDELKEKLENIFK